MLDGGSWMVDGERVRVGRRVKGGWTGCREKASGALRHHPDMQNPDMQNTGHGKPRIRSTQGTHRTQGTHTGIKRFIITQRNATLSDCIDTVPESGSSSLSADAPPPGSGPRWGGCPVEEDWGRGGGAVGGRR